MKTLLVPAGVLSLMLVGLGAGDAAWSEVYPSKPVRLVVAGPAAGGADVLARPLAQKVSESFGQQILVDNRGGGAGIMATQAVLAAPPDGYTIFFANAINMSIAPAVRAKLAFDPVTDFSPVTLVATTPLMVAVHPSLPVKSVRDLVVLAKSRPKQVLAASNGEGTIQHLTIEMLNRAASIALLHVPYKGGTPAVIDTVGGHTQVIITAVPTVLSQIRASRLRGLAVTSGQRSVVIPEMPTLAESGFPGFESVQWYGIFARAKTPAAIIDRWSSEVRNAMDSSGVKARLTQEGAEPAANGPQALAEFHRIDIVKWQKVVRDSNIVLN